MKTVDVYKHAKVEGLCIYVDPETKKLSSNLAMSVELLKVFEANPNNSLLDLISNGMFLKVCDVIMEVTKVPKVYPCQRTNCSESFNNEVDQKKHMKSCQIIPIQKQFKCKSPGMLLFYILLTGYYLSFSNSPKYCNVRHLFNNEVDQKKHMQSCQIIPIQKQFKCKSPGKFFLSIFCSQVILCHFQIVLNIVI